MDKCKTCVDKDTKGDQYPCIFCNGWDKYTEYKNPTNADRIRSMSDEELADFLNNVEGKFYSKSMIPTCKCVEELAKNAGDIMDDDYNDITCIAHTQTGICVIVDLNYCPQCGNKYKEVE